MLNPPPPPLSLQEYQVFGPRRDSPGRSREQKEGEEEEKGEGREEPVIKVC